MVAILSFWHLVLLRLSNFELCALLNFKQGRIHDHKMPLEGSASLILGSHLVLITQKWTDGPTDGRRDRQTLDKHIVFWLECLPMSK